jgi:hypothetical protein
MSGKVQVAVIMVMLALGGFGVQRAVRAVVGTPGVLYLAGQYKLLRGDADSALRMFQQAASVPCSARTKAQTALSSCRLHPAVTSAWGHLPIEVEIIEPTLNR